MPSFGKTSESKLSTAHPLLQAVCRRTILFVDFSVIDGFRGERRQNAAFDAGKSKVRYPDSKHNVYPSNAVDLLPYPGGWEDLEAFCMLAGAMRATAWQIGVGLRWGGDWDGDWHTKDEKFRDYAHYELVEGIWLP